MIYDLFFPKWNYLIPFNHPWTGDVQKKSTALALSGHSSSGSESFSFLNPRLKREDSSFSWNSIPQSRGEVSDSQLGDFFIFFFKETPLTRVSWTKISRLGKMDENNGVIMVTEVIVHWSMHPRLVVCLFNRSAYWPIGLVKGCHLYCLM